MSKRILHMLAEILPSDPDAVEYAEGQKYPKAFRLFRAGENTTDDGVFVFTERSASLLLEQQATRKRQYPFDFDHLSLLSDRPATSGRAAGYHSLAVRNGELWAVDIDWCADVKDGLSQDPPLWRYFSPAFDARKSGEVISYTNCAICINPKSHDLPALAAEAPQPSETRNKKEKAMTVEELLKIIASLPDEQKAEVLKALQGDGDGDEQLAEGDKDKDKGANGSEESAEPPKDKDDAPMAKAMAVVLRRLEHLEREKDAREFESIVSAHSGLTPEMVKVLKSLPVTHARQVALAIRAGASAPSKKPTVGEDKGDEEKEKDQDADRVAIRAAMGLQSKKGSKLLAIRGGDGISFKTADKKGA